MTLKAIVRHEAGYEPALYGMSLSHSLEVGYALTDSKITRAAKLAHMHGGHNKFLESIMLWIDVWAPRYWWQQADTYRISTKQSESTMHTILKQKLNNDHFANDLPSDMLCYLNDLIARKEFELLKAVLPEGFMQRRMWCMSYKTLQNIYLQRCNHKLQEWHDFLDQVVDQIDHRSFIVQPPVVG